MAGDGPGWTSVAGTGERPISLPRQAPDSPPQARRLTPLHADFACTPSATVIEITHFNLMVLAKISVGLRLVAISAHSAFGIVVFPPCTTRRPCGARPSGGAPPRKCCASGEDRGENHLSTCHCHSTKSASRYSRAGTLSPHPKMHR